MEDIADIVLSAKEDIHIDIHMVHSKSPWRTCDIIGRKWSSCLGSDG